MVSVFPQIILLNKNSGNDISDKLLPKIQMFPFTFVLKIISADSRRKHLHCDLLACLLVWREGTLKVHPEDMNNTGASHSFTVHLVFVIADMKIKNFV